MKLNQRLSKRLLCLQATLIAGLLLSGCGSKPSPDPSASSQIQERERLQAANQELPQARVENEEVQRLKRENQDLPKLRSQYQEAARLRKENEQLGQQIAKVSASKAAAEALAAKAQAAAALNAEKAKLEGEKAKELTQEAGVLNEGDDIFIEPKYLSAILPGYDWEKFPRKEPLGIRALLEKSGVPLTNVSQLKEYGITNYVVRRAPPGAPAPAQETR